MPDGDEAGAHVEARRRRIATGDRQNHETGANAGRPEERGSQQLASRSETAETRVDPHLIEMDAIGIGIVDPTPRKADQLSTHLRYERDLGWGLRSCDSLTQPVGICA